MRTFTFRVEIREGSDERWEELEELALDDAAKLVRDDLLEAMEHFGLIHHTVELIDAKQDDPDNGQN